MKHGDLTKIARASGRSVSHMCDIVNRRRRPSPELAADLERVTGVPRLAWLYPDEFENPFLDKKHDTVTENANG